MWCLEKFSCVFKNNKGHHQISHLSLCKHPSPTILSLEGIKPREWNPEKGRVKFLKTRKNPFWKPVF